MGIDITYIKVNGKFRYLCVIIDLFSRKVISYSISNNPDANLVTHTFNSAYAKRKPTETLIFHSDRGCQYTSKKFRSLLDSFNVVQSFSDKGYPYDNAVAESFFKYLKLEETNRRNYCSTEELKLSLFQYIDGYYNKKRSHSANNILSPDEKEALCSKRSLSTIK